mmetsp:Transcript_8435/g.23216  ORF Transcript_8435/g.23216 Transcript_8435/m.23216 type:complete len:311 (-) Transcript_8435:1896-2828(-)
MLNTSGTSSSSPRAQVHGDAKLVPSSLSLFQVFTSVVALASGILGAQSVAGSSHVLATRRTLSLALAVCAFACAFPIIPALASTASSCIPPMLQYLRHQGGEWIAQASTTVTRTLEREFVLSGLVVAFSGSIATACYAAARMARSAAASWVSRTIFTRFVFGAEAGEHKRYLLSFMEKSTTGYHSLAVRPPRVGESADGTSGANEMERMQTAMMRKYQFRNTGFGVPNLSNLVGEVHDAPVFQSPFFRARHRGRPHTAPVVPEHAHLGDRQAEQGQAEYRLQPAYSKRDRLHALHTARARHPLPGSGGGH